MTIVDPVRDELGWAFAITPADSSRRVVCLTDPITVPIFERSLRATDPEYDER